MRAAASLYRPCWSRLRSCTRSAAASSSPSTNDRECQLDVTKASLISDFKCMLGGKSVQSICEADAVAAAWTYPRMNLASCLGALRAYFAGSLCVIMGDHTADIL